MHKNHWVIVGLCFTFALGACNPEPATDEPTPAATTEFPVVESVTPSPTADLSTAISSGDLNDLLQIADLGPRREVEHGGFALDLPQGFTPAYRPGTIILAWEESGMILSAGGGLETEPISMETGLENFIMPMTSDIPDLSLGEYESVRVADQEGLATNFNGTLGNEQIAGRLVYLNTSDLQFLVVMLFSFNSDWEEDDLPVFQDMLDTIELFPPTPLTDLCPISADPTFGYTQENPVRVGQGDPLTGPRMERDYLELLRGPNGESVSFVRSGSSITEDSIVDEYQVTYGDPPTTVVLYLDPYHDGQFRLPQGLTCGN